MECSLDKKHKTLHIEIISFWSFPTSEQFAINISKENSVIETSNIILCALSFKDHLW